MRALIFISTLCVAITTNFLRSQERFDPIVSVGHNPTVEFEVLGGVHWNEHLSFQLFCRNMTLLNDLYSGGINHHQLLFGIQVNYRLLDHWVSPVIAINSGTAIYSSARGQFIQDNAVYNSETIYNYGTFVGKVKFLADFRYKTVSFQIGGSGNYYLYEVINCSGVYHYKEGNIYNVSSLEYYDWFFFGIEANLVYTINRKKNEK